MRLRIIKSLLFVFSIFALTISCTNNRGSSKASLRFTLPSNGALNSNLVIGFAAINIHHPAYPSAIVETHDFNDDQTISESDLIIEVEDLEPTDGAPVLVQFLAVLDDQTNGSMRFAYGDIEIPLEAGDNVANIVSSYIGSSTKMGTVSGRYLSSATDGPSGTLIGSFKPTGKPAMDVVKTGIFNGWFNDLIILESTAATFDYRVQETGQVIFDDVNIASFVALGTSTHLMKVEVPKTYRRGESRPESQQDLFIGFFSDNPANLTGKTACYLQHSSEFAIPEYYTDASHTSPLIYNNNAPLAGRAFVLGGGQANNFNNHYADNLCDISSNNYINFHPNHLGDHDGGLVGMNGPFQAIKPLKDYDSFIDHSFNPAGGGSIDFNWQLLPGVTTASVSGISVYAKYETNSQYNGGGDSDLCSEEALEEGMQLITDIPIGTTSYSFTGDNGLSVSAANWYNWQFRFCPFKNNGGDRNYFESGVAKHCMNNCDNYQHFGTGAQASATTVSSGTFNGVSGMYGDSVRVTAIDTTPTHHTLISNPASASAAGASGGFAAGKELLLMIATEDGGGCDPYDPGHFEFTTNLDTNTDGSTFIDIKIPKGSFIEDITPSNLTSTANAGATHCYVQAVQVPHFRDLIIDSMVLSANPMQFGNVGGGIIAFRVNGTLTLNDDIDLDSDGFAGGGGAVTNGAGSRGVRNAGTPTYTGGIHNSTPSTDGGGGGGYNPGGDGNDGAVGSGGAGTLAMERQGIRMFFGGGGGAGNNGGAVGAGNGGGIVFIAAKNIVNNSGASRTITANGGNATNASGDASGGGGGGSINIIADDISGSFNIDIEAKGGGGASEGGGGGGGWIRYGACDIQNTINPDNSADMVSGGANKAQDGNSDVEADPHFCNSDP